MPISKGTYQEIGHRRIAYRDKIEAVVNYGAEPEPIDNTVTGFDVLLMENVTKGQPGYLNSTGAYLADNTSITTVAEFFFLQDGSSGDVVKVNKTGIVLTSGTLTQGGAVYLSTSGSITQTVPSSNIFQFLGEAIDTKNILIQIDQPIIL